LDADDVWLPEFQCYDGLVIERAGLPGTQQTTHSVAFHEVAESQTNGLPSNPEGCI
jgi:hypothetical protein